MASRWLYLMITISRRFFYSLFATVPTLASCRVDESSFPMMITWIVLMINFCGLRRHLFAVCVLFPLMTIVIVIAPAIWVDQIRSLSGLALIQVASVINHTQPVLFTGFPYGNPKRFRFWQISPIVEPIISWLVDVSLSSGFTQVKPVISVKSFSTLHDDQHSQYPCGDGIKYKIRRICWCFGRRLWDPGKSSLQKSNMLVEEKMPCIIKRKRCVSYYKIHDQDPFQATYQYVLLIRVMRKAFWSFIYKMLAFYEYIKKRLNRFYLLPVRLPFGKQGYFYFFIEIVINFLYLFQRLYLNVTFVSCKL